ncbi:MAG: LamB/YcsF family protein [Acidaminococcales bacterium]|nr:LamB/YcsF family protein [Acidaminococcales bacterium]
MKIDLNCDTGENFSMYRLGEDTQVMPLVTSVNIACGFHASDPLNMRRAVRLAKQYGAAVGAHPSFPDLVGFGRRVMNLAPEEIIADVIYQVSALKGFCAAEGVPMQHVKAHGALYNVAEKDAAVAETIARAIKAVDANLIMVCMAKSEMVKGAKAAGVRWVEEFFADRAYTAEGNLVSRKVEGSVIHDAAAVSGRVLRVIKEKKVKSIDGTDVAIDAQTICVHGDTPGAVELIRKIRDDLQSAGLQLEAFGQWL